MVPADRDMAIDSGKAIVSSVTTRCIPTRALCALHSREESLRRLRAQVAASTGSRNTLHIATTEPAIEQQTRMFKEIRFW